MNPPPSGDHYTVEFVGATPLDGFVLSFTMRSGGKDEEGTMNAEELLLDAEKRIKENCFVSGSFSPSA